jgi:archaellum biogenesis ATPase FlaH
VYHSVENAPLIRVLRFSDPKEFRQQRWSRELEEWIWGLGPRETRPAAVLYHLAEVRFAVAQRQPIWLCEGEKDVEALNLHFSERTGEDPVEGFATCNAGGSSQFTYHHAEQLRDAVQVNVIRDKDDAGAAWSRKIFGLLEDAAGTGMIDIRIWEVPMEKQGADWSDWAAEGGSVDGLVLVFPTPVERQRFAIRGGASVPKALHRVNLKVFNSVPALSWPSDLPKFPECSGLTILSGQTGSAKSWLAIAMSLQSAMLGIEVAYVSVELDVATVMKRAQAYFSGNLGLVPECWGLYVPMAHEPWENVLNVLEERCTGNPLLLFIDSINTFVVNEEAPGEHDTFQLGTISERIMQCRTMVNRGRGLIGVVLVSEANAAGGMKGRLDFRANISINMEKREDNHRQIDITIVKNWDGYAGQLGLHELDTENGRFTFIPEHEEECAL